MLGTTKISEYKQAFGLDDVSDSEILTQIKKVLEELTHNYRKLFEVGELPEKFKKNDIEIRKSINEEVKKIITYYPSIKSLPIAVGYFDKDSNKEVMHEISEKDIQAALYELYTCNEYICARTIKTSILNRLKAEDNTEELYQKYQELPKNIKKEINQKANANSGVIPDKGKNTLVISSRESTTVRRTYNPKPKKNKGKYKMLRIHK